MYFHFWLPSTLCSITLQSGAASHSWVVPAKFDPLPIASDGPCPNHDPSTEYLVWSADGAVHQLVGRRTPRKAVSQPKSYNQRNTTNPSALSQPPPSLQKLPDTFPTRNPIHKSSRKLSILTGAPVCAVRQNGQLHQPSPGQYCPRFQL